MSERRLHCNQCDSWWKPRASTDIPVQCPRCKRVDWQELNKGGRDATSPEHIKPDMDTLRVMAKGVVPASESFEHLAEVPRCPYTEYDEQEGETMACGLNTHSGKVKHGNWRRL